MMSDFEIPSGPKALTPEWLTRALRSTGTINDATVKSFSVEVLGEGQAFTGQITRLSLKYDIDEEGVPKSLISKFPASDPGLRTVWNRYRLYEREIRFYKEITAVGEAIRGLGEHPDAFFARARCEAVGWKG